MFRIFHDDVQYPLRRRRRGSERIQTLRLAPDTTVDKNERVNETTIVFQAGFASIV